MRAGRDRAGSNSIARFVGLSLNHRTVKCVACGTARQPLAGRRYSC